MNYITYLLLLITIGFIPPKARALNLSNITISVGEQLVSFSRDNTSVQALNDTGSQPHVHPGISKSELTPQDKTEKRRIGWLFLFLGALIPLAIYLTRSRIRRSQ